MRLVNVGGNKYRLVVVALFRSGALYVPVCRARMPSTFFVAFVDPAPATAIDSNILFDKNQDPINVNTNLLAVCDPSEQSQGAAKRFRCEQGPALLSGTGYGKGESTCLTSGGGAATGWLKTSAPVMPGQLVTLRFAIWDTNDTRLDSTALLDHFSWVTFEGAPETVIEIQTVPVL